MGGPKRASMREGPLAALFRKTDEDAPTTAADAVPAPATEAAAPAVPAGVCARGTRGVCARDS